MLSHALSKSTWVHFHKTKTGIVFAMAESSPPREPQQRRKWQPGLPGSCKGSKWLLELASVPQWRWKWVIAPALGTSGRPKLPCGPFWEPDGALGLPRNRKSARNGGSRLPRRHRGTVRSKVLLKGAVSTRLFLASLFPYGFPCVTVLVEVRHVTSK